MQIAIATFILFCLACLTTTSSCLHNYPCIQSILYTFLYPFITSYAFNPKNIHSLLHFYTHIHLTLKVHYFLVYNQSYVNSPFHHSALTMHFNLTADWQRKVSPLSQLFRCAAFKVCSTAPELIETN